MEAYAHSFEAANALAWLVAGGVDVIVEDAPRNWLAEPPRQAPLATVLPVAQAHAAPRAAAPQNPAAALVATADTLAALDAALVDLPHPLRRPAPPQLLTGAIASGLVILLDQPENPDSPAMRLLDRMLAAIGLDAATCARGHLLPWATPAGRAPRDEEIAAFAPYLARALTLAAPRLVLAFGDKAAALATRAPGQPVRGIASMRGKWQTIGDAAMIASFHPRQLLTQPELKRLAWADLQAFQARIQT